MFKNFSQKKNTDIYINLSYDRTILATHNPYQLSQSSQGWNARYSHLP